MNTFLFLQHVFFQRFVHGFFIKNIWVKLRCLLFGHRIHPALLHAPVANRHCECGVEVLAVNQITRSAHHVDCFLKGHVYRRLQKRQGYVEWICIQCGHPLLLKPKTTRAVTGLFKKKVRYQCNLAGHAVEWVVARNGYQEYACHCGHNFLKQEVGLKEIKHPPACFLKGHFVEFVTDRQGYWEFVCRVCGHPFLF